MKKQRSYLLLIGIIAVLTIVGLVQYFIRGQTELNLPISGSRSLDFSQNDLKENPTLAPTKALAIVVVDFGNGRKISAKTSARNVYEALLEIAKEKGFNVETKQFKYGVLVEKIDNVGNTKDSYWTYFVNNKMGEVAADRYLIYPSDKVEWKYQKNK